MKTTLRFTAATIILTACIVTGVIYISEYNPSKQLKSQEQIQNLPINDDYKYIVREYEGKIAVFGKGNSVPDMIFDTYTKYLPEFDRTALKKGIYISNYEELIKLIEDYIS